MRTLFMATILFAALALSPTTLLAQSFSDIDKQHPQYAAIESLKNLGIINGYQDGTFQSNKPVTRAEAVKMILKTAKIELASDAQTDFTDIAADAWYTPYIATAKYRKIVNGYAGTNEFRPNNTVTKAEFIKMSLFALGKDVSKHVGAKNIASDVHAGDWYAAYISYAKTLGIITPSQAGDLKPNQPLTRGECSDILYRLLVIEQGGKVQKDLSMVEAKLVEILVSLNKDDIVMALAHAQSAVSLSQELAEQSPEHALTQAVHQIALGFEQLCLAYQAGADGDNDALRQHTDKAKQYAGAAFNKDNSTQPIGKQIKAQADVLLRQIKD